MDASFPRWDKYGLYTNDSVFHKWFNSDLCARESDPLPGHTQTIFLISHLQIFLSTLYCLVLGLRLYKLHSSFTSWLSNLGHYMEIVRLEEEEEDTLSFLKLFGCCCQQQVPAPELAIYSSSPRRSFIVSPSLEVSVLAPRSHVSKLLSSNKPNLFTQTNYKHRYKYTQHYHYLQAPLLYSEKEMATHTCTLGWKTPWTEEPGRLQSTGSQRVGHDWATSLSLFFCFIHKSIFVTIIFSKCLSGHSKAEGCFGHYFDSMCF